MNIMFCGDANVEKGILVASLSLAQTVHFPVRIFVMTAKVSYEGRSTTPISEEFCEKLNALMKAKLPGSSVELVDATDAMSSYLPLANIQTRFTPCCMLRLYADLIPGLPDKILYLDTDVICRRSIEDLYRTNIDAYEFAGVLDYYGRFAFRNDVLHMDYVNSGVLLINMANIRKTGLFARCRKACAEQKMFMPDQSSLNKFATNKLVLPRKYNEQRKLHEDAVIQHFTTSFRFVPYPHLMCVKPWEEERMHTKLKLHEYDDLLKEYSLVKTEFDL